MKDSIENIRKKIRERQYEVDALMAREDLYVIHSSSKKCDCGVFPTIFKSYRIMCPCCGKSTETYCENDIDALIKEWNEMEAQCNER